MSLPSITIQSIQSLILISFFNRHAFNQGSSIPVFQSSIINHQSSILNSQFSFINHQFSFINHQFSFINHQSSIINHQSSIINHQSSFPLARQNIRRTRALSEAGIATPILSNARFAALIQPRRFVERAFDFPNPSSIASVSSPLDGSFRSPFTA